MIEPTTTSLGPGTARAYTRAVGFTDWIKKLNRKLEPAAVSASAQNTNPNQTTAAGAVAAGMAETEEAEQEETEG